MCKKTAHAASKPAADGRCIKVCLVSFFSFQDQPIEEKAEQRPEKNGQCIKEDGMNQINARKYGNHPGRDAEHLQHNVVMVES